MGLAAPVAKSTERPKAEIEWGLGRGPVPRTAIHCSNPNCLKSHEPFCLPWHQNFRVHKPAIHLLPAFFPQYLADHSIKRKMAF